MNPNLNSVVASGSSSRPGAGFVFSVDYVKWIGCARALYGPGRVSRLGERYRPFAIVIHLSEPCIQQRSLLEIDRWFLTPPDRRPRERNQPTSAHYAVGADGQCHQYVKEDDRAYHAGYVKLPRWRQIVEAVTPDLYTVGIMIDGGLDAEWPEEQRQVVSWLVAGIANRWQIPLDGDHVIGHEHICSHATCPGPQIDFPEIIGRAQRYMPEMDWSEALQGVRRIR